MEIDFPRIYRLFPNWAQHDDCESMVPRHIFLIRVYTEFYMGFMDGVGDTYHLFQNTINVVARNPAILKPSWRQLIIAGILYFLLALSVVGFFWGGGSTLSIIPLLVLILILLLLFLFPFISIYYRAAQSWMVYQTFTGKTSSFEDGIMRARQNKGDIITIGIFDFILSALANRLKSGVGKGGWVSMLLNILLFIAGKAIEEGWDLIGHYLLPASIIEDKNVLQVLPTIPNIRKNVPGALAGTFAIDFVGDVARGSINGLFLLLVILAVIVGFVFNNWILLPFIIILMIGFNLFAGIAIDTVKTIYFTLFYVSVTRPMSIPPALRKEITSYLNFPGSVNTSMSGATVPSAPMSAEQKKNALDQIQPSIAQYREQGYSNTEITQFLVQAGWPKDIIAKALKKGKK